MIGERYGPEQQRRIMYQSICHRPHRDGGLFSQCDCLRLGMLFAQQHGRLPGIYDFGPEAYLPSRQSITSHFGTVACYREALQALCWEFPGRGVRLFTYPPPEALSAHPMPVRGAGARRSAPRPPGPSPSTD